MLHDTLAFIVNDVDAKIKARGGNVEASTMASRFLTVYVVWLAASSHDAMPGGWLRQVERWVRASHFVRSRCLMSARVYLPQDTRASSSMFLLAGSPTCRRMAS